MFKQLLKYLSLFQSLKPTGAKLFFYDIDSGEKVAINVIGFGSLELERLAEDYPQYDFGLVYENGAGETFFKISSKESVLYFNTVSYNPNDDDASVKAFENFHRSLFLGGERDVEVSNKAIDVFEFLYSEEDEKTNESKMGSLKSLVEEGLTFEDFVAAQDVVIKRGNTYFYRN